MKKVLLTTLLILCFSGPTFAAKGAVTLMKRGCDHFLVYTSNDDYALMEWFGGHYPSKGDIFVGNFNTFGFKEYYCSTADGEISVYIEDWGLSRREAISQFYEKCED